MLREHEHRQSRPGPPRRQRALQALVRVRGREPDVDDGDVRLQLRERPGQFGPALHGRQDLEVVRLQHADQSVTQQEQIFG